MHITLSSDALAAAMKSSVAVSNSTLPILADTLIRTEGRGRVSFRTTDMEVDVVAYADATVHNDGAQCLAAHLLRPVVAQAGDISIKADVLTRGRSRYKIGGHPVDAFPSADVGQTWKQIDIDPLAVAAALRAVSYAVDSTNVQRQWAGVMLVNDTAWGCDGQRGAYADLAWAGPSVALPQRQVERVIEALVPGAVIEVGNAAGGRAALLRVRTDCLTLSLRLLDIQPFQFRTAIESKLPGDTAPRVRFRTTALKALVRQFVPFSEYLAGKTKLRFVELVRENDEVLLTDRTGDTREALTPSLDSHHGRPFREAMNPKFLLDALNVVDSDLVDLWPGAAAQGMHSILQPVVADEAPVVRHMFMGVSR